MLVAPPYGYGDLAAKGADRGEARSESKRPLRVGVLLRLALTRND